MGHYLLTYCSKTLIHSGQTHRGIKNTRHPKVPTFLCVMFTNLNGPRNVLYDDTWASVPFVNEKA